MNGSYHEFGWPNFDNIPFSAIPDRAGIKETHHPLI